MASLVDVPPPSSPRVVFARAARAATLDAFQWGVRLLEYVPPLRRWAVAAVERRLARPGGVECLRNPPAVDDDKRAAARAILEIADRALAEHRLSRRALRGLLRVLAWDVLLRRDEIPGKRVFRARHGVNPPDFLVLSPGKACNLSCTGCYANSGPVGEKLDADLVFRIVADAYLNWGTRFFVISGGEPLAWRSGKRGVIDLAEEYPDCFFIMYTNGTLVDDEVARRLARAGNLSPGLSLEGLRERTDDRRGAGVFGQVVAAMERLRRAGVLFGVSLTATRENADELLSDAMADFVREQHAAYVFLFHYMPIGRAFSLDLMMTPAQRIRLWHRGWQLIRERRMFIADFWSGGTLSNGCVGAGRPGGYFHIDWTGAVSPCVFMPYAPVRIQDVYAKGGTLEDVYDLPFFAALRGWQRDYGYREKGETQERAGNWLMPCPIRDHHAEWLRILRAHGAEPANAEARAALEDPAYHEGLDAFDRELAGLADPLWASRYTGR